ncbi:tetratricopeptide repeat protein [Gilliamella sp. WF3-4]|uniref:tetratricopeptide repeat protein n=1 Tax=Gilliamella sp. WF3-4 TaxID=3120255 RepID=UPI00080DB6B5|nr:tetratricopeptide repeat protein [Gilliamella apicola]OCG17316.1 hypothetical protein A9G47_09395 [Gilliamella apicola]
MIMLAFMLCHSNILTADTNKNNLIIQAENGDKIAQYSLANLLLSQNIDKKYNDKVFYWYQQSAQQGYAEAQFALAIIYEELGNDEQAIIWLEKAAKQNHVQSQYSLGVNYRFGFWRVKPDSSKSLYWLTKAAQQDYTAAQVELGNLYLTSSGIDTDYKKGLYWYKKAAEKNNAFAQLNLGIIEMAQSNYKQAFFWLNQACKNNLTDACHLASTIKKKK